MTIPVQSLVSLRSPIGTTSNVSIPIIVTSLSVEATAAWGDDRVKRFTADAWAEQAKALEIIATDPIYVALQTMFSDHPRQLFKPAYAVVVRRDTPVAQKMTVTVVGNADGTYTHTINDSAFSFAAAGKTVTEIRDALILAIDAGDEPVTIAAVGANAYTAEANEAGIPFANAVSSPDSDMTIETTLANKGIYDDLVDAETEDRTGYMVTETSFDDDVTAEVSKFVQSASRPMVAGIQSTSSDIPSEVDTDAWSKLAALGRWRTWGVWHNSATQHLAAGWIGRAIAYPVGQINWAHKQITGCTAVDFTEPALAAYPGYLEAKNANRYDAVGLGSTLYATMMDGRYIDQVQLKDLLDMGITERLLKFLQTTDIVSYDFVGITKIKGELEVYLKEIADQGALDQDTITVTAVPAGEVPSGDQAIRNYSKLTWSAKARGAINRLYPITGIVEL